MLRLKTEIWVKAYLRTCFAADAFAAVVHRGDPDAGAVFIKVSQLDGLALVFSPVPQGFADVEYERKWCAHFDDGLRADRDVDQFLARQRDLDRDAWVIEVEDRLGRHFLGDALVTLE